MSDMPLKEVAEALDAMKIVYKASSVTADAINQAASLVRKVDAGEYEEVKHAHWIEHGDGSVTCTACHRRMSAGVYGWPRCCNCGARMDGKDGSNE